MTVALVIALAVAVLMDVRFRRIPNAVTLPLLAAAILHGLWTHTATMAVVGALVCGLPVLCLAVRGLIGPGDAKLMLAVGAVAGPLAPMALLWVSVAGGVLGLVWRRGYVPYAVAIAAGTGMALR